MITSFEGFEDCLYLHLDDGMLRLEPYLPSVVRVTYTKKKEFNQKVSRIVLPEGRKHVEWSVDDTDKNVVFTTGQLQITADKNSGMLSYRDRHAMLLMKEPPNGGRTLEEIDVCRTVFDPSAEVKVTDGIDGIKATVSGKHKEITRKAYHAKLEFDLDKDEALYGLGSHEEGMMNLRGQHQYLYQENMKAVVPMMVSTNGYGILLDCQSLMTFHDDAFGTYLWCDVVDELDYYFIYGPSFDKIILGYRDITGMAAMLPRWAFGYMQSKERYKTQKELIEIAKEYRKRAIPIDTLILDWQTWPGNLWGQKTLDPERFPDPEEMMNELHSMNIKLMISIWPNMSEGGDNFKEFTEQGLMLADRTHYDPFTNEGRELYWKQVQEGLFKHGIDAWWCDCTEPFEADWRGTVKPEPEERMRINTEEAKKYIDPAEINSYSLMHSKGIYDGQRKTGSQKRVTNLTRSSYAGQHRYSTITWSGDTSANWTTLKNQIPAGLNFCAAGEPYWTTDIGAFFTAGSRKGKFFKSNPSFPIPWFISGDYDDGCDDMGYRELYVRWFQYGAFLPIFRSHGTGTPREIWRFGEPGSMFYDALVKFDTLRYRLIPYIYSIAGMVTHFGYTMMRALAFDFRDDKKVYDIKDQYMFGPNLMVCPVTEPMYYGYNSQKLKRTQKTRNVYLPEGCDWYDFWTNKYYKGGQTVCAAAPIDIIPIYVRAGSILPIGPSLQSTAEICKQPVQLCIYQGGDCEFMLYDDAGDGYSYETGDYSFTKLLWNDSTHELSIVNSDGNSIYSKSFCLIVMIDGGNALSNEMRSDAMLQYNGNDITKKL